MAESIADLLTGSVLQTSQKAPDLAGALTQGAQLAQTMEQTKAARQKIELDKQNQEITKWDKVAQMYEHASKLPEGRLRNAFTDGYIQQAIQALGLKMDPTVQKQISIDPSLITSVKGMIADGRINLPKALGLMNDAEEFNKMYPELKQWGGAEAFRKVSEEIPQTLGDVYQKRTLEEGKTLRADTVQRGTQNRADVTNYQKVKDDFDTATKPLREAMTAGDNALNLLNTNGPIAAEAVKTQLARLAGEKGPLTDQDVARFGGSRDLLSRAESFLTRQISGNITPETRTEYKAIIREMQDVVRAKVQAEEDRQVDSAAGLGLDPLRARKILAAKNIAQSSAKNGKAIYDSFVSAKLSGFKSLASPEEKNKFLQAVATKFKKPIEEVKKSFGE